MELASQVPRHTTTRTDGTSNSLIDLLALPNMNKAHVQAAERDRRNKDACKLQSLLGPWGPPLIHSIHSSYVSSEARERQS